MKKDLDTILARKIIAEVRDVPPEQIIPTMWALADGGIHCACLSFDPSSQKQEEETLISLGKIRDEFGESVTLGASNVFSPALVRAAALEGAVFILSPGTNQEIIITTKALDLVSIPGVFTPTEIMDAIEWGADIVHLFPVSFLNVGYIRALKEKINQIPFFAGGGVSPRNARSLLEAGCAGISTGSSLVDTRLIEGKDYFSIRTKAREYIMALVNDPPVYPD